MAEAVANKSKEKLSAFDNVPHDILFQEKLPAFGVEQDLINTIS